MFWGAVGWAVYVVSAPVHPVLRGVLVSWFLNVPWVIEFVISQGQVEFLLPMVILGTVFGAAIGFVSQVVHRVGRRHAVA